MMSHGKTRRGFLKTIAAGAAVLATAGQLPARSQAKKPNILFVFTDDERWKLIEYNAAGVRNTQLFDLQNDPDEVHNLAADPQYAEQLKRLRSLLIKSQKDFDDPCPSFLDSGLAPSNGAVPLKAPVPVLYKGTDSPTCNHIIERCIV